MGNNADKGQEKPLRQPIVQQSRALSIHEYRSANLLASVRNLPRLAPPTEVLMSEIVWYWCAQGSRGYKCN